MLDRRNHCFELYHLDSAVDRFEYHQRLTSMIYGGRDRSLKSFRISLSRLKNIAAQFHNHRLVSDTVHQTPVIVSTQLCFTEAQAEAPGSIL